MNEESDLLSSIKALVSENRYRVRLHAARHITEEGFTEADLTNALSGKSRILENYPEENRCLIVGYFRMSEKVTSPLHVICDYSNDELVDIVTAYLPEKPWWSTPTKRGREK